MNKNKDGAMLGGGGHIIIFLVTNIYIYIYIYIYDLPKNSMIQRNRMVG